MRVRSLLPALLLLGICAALPLGAEDEASGQGAAAPEAAPPAQPERAPISQIEGTAPAETPQERMERFKRERGAGSDKPFEGFATNAEREMEQEREAAIRGSARSVQALETEQVVEDYEAEVEKLQDVLARLGGSWGGTACMEQEPDWSTQDDWIRYRKLAREDFRSEQPDKLRLTVAAKGGSAAAYLATLLTCVVTPSVVEETPGIWAASLAGVRYFPVLSREQSYLVAETEAGSYEFQHEQLHFDLAHQLARWLNQNQGAIRARMAAKGRTQEEALGRLQLAFGKHMLGAQRDLRTLEVAYDRDTQHGRASLLQTEWNFRIQDGLEAMAKKIKLETRAYLK